jgi:serine/threonine protein kinase
MELALGQNVGRYELESKIGEGGMAVVYKARHKTLNLPFALKFLKVTDKSIQQRLIQEGRLQATLRHPNVVRVTDVLIHEGSPCLVMEYIDGPSLDEWLAKNEPGIPQTEEMFLQILDAVQEAHDLGFVHRDLKPANIMLQYKKKKLIPKVCDFGLAKALDKDLVGHTQTGVTMGTPAYMAPEQVRNSKDADSRADIFALGAILYEMVTSKRAFCGKDTLELLNAVALHPHTPTRKLVKSVPNRIGLAIDGALIKDPDFRIPDCSVFKDVLLGKREWEKENSSSGDTLYYSLEGVDEGDVQESPTVLKKSDLKAPAPRKVSKAVDQEPISKQPPKKPSSGNAKTQGIVTGHNLFLRSGPTVAADMVALLRRGSTVKVLGHFDSINAQEGQLKDDFEFEPLDGESYRLPAGLAFAFTGENETHYRVEFIAGTVRDVGYIPKALVRVMGDERWYEVETKQGTGWVIARYLRLY